jgi:hypothetical protein
MQCDCHTLGQDCAIRANECRRLSKSVQLQVLFRKPVLWICLYHLDTEINGMGDCKDTNRSWTTLLSGRAVSDVQIHAFLLQASYLVRV